MLAADDDLRPRQAPARNYDPPRRPRHPRRARHDAAVAPSGPGAAERAREVGRGRALRRRGGLVDDLVVLASPRPRRGLAIAIGLRLVEHVRRELLPPDAAVRRRDHSASSSFDARIAASSRADALMSP